MTTRSALFVLLFAASAGGWGCGASRTQVPPGTTDADKFLFTRGEEEFKDKNWVKAREYYRQIVDNYPQSTFRPDAKLAVGDSYIGEHTTEALLLAVNEFREFLTFYPTNPRADYAQYRLAYAYHEQMLAPDRDQSATRDVIKELVVFTEKYPNSALAPDAKKLLREAKDRLSESSYRIGYTYYRMKWYPGAIDRFRDVLKDDPEFTHRDAVYFYMGEALRLSNLKDTAKLAEALPYYERIIKEFETSEYLENAKKRIAELKTP